MSEIKLTWGGNMFNGTAMPTLYWGARTIFHRATVEYEKRYKRRPKMVKTKAWLDFLPDRKGWAGTLYENPWHPDSPPGPVQPPDLFKALENRAEFKCFCQWLQKDAMPALTAWAQNPQGVFEINEDVAKYHMRASDCNNSGYCYVAAWRE